jgi:glycosyltransferase involved in cell wall biosynthesis
MGTESSSPARRLRVLHLITDAGPHPYFDLIGEHADRTRFEVTIATLGSVGALHEDVGRMGLRSFGLGADTRSRHPRATLALARILRRDRVDVLQTHLLEASLAGLPAARLARTPASILTAHHSHEIPLHRKPLLTSVDRLCARLSDAVIAPSLQMRDTLVQIHRISPDKIAVIRHGFDLDRLHPASTDRSTLRAQLGVDGRVVLTSLGRVYWIKNQEALLRAFAAVSEEVPESLLVVAGGGDYTRLRDVVRELRIEKRVLLLGARADVPRLLAASDLFVHPALAESFGMVIVEAMAMGLPVVSTPVGIAPEVIEEGATGILASDAGDEALADALRRAFAARSRWPEIGTAAREKALAFPAAAMVREYQELYLKLLGRTQSASRSQPAAPALMG